MKIRTIIMGLLMTAMMPLANANSSVITLEQIQLAELSRTVSTLSLVNWKVGDAQNFKVTLGFGMEGTMNKEATKEEGNAIWLKTVLKLPIANDTTEALIDRDSGKVLKFIHNGKEAEVPSGELEIVSTNNETIEVPAGKFKTIHVIAKSKDVKQIEIWINQREIALDGSAKVFMDQGSMKITMVLTKFVKQ